MTRQSLFGTRAAADYPSQSTSIFSDYKNPSSSKEL